METFNTKEIAHQLNRHISTINRLIINLDIVPVEKKLNKKNYSVNYYSKEQMHIINENLCYKSIEKGRLRIINRVETYHIYESKMNYLNEL